MAPWGRRTWTIPRARIGTSLGPLHAQSRLFDPIVIEGPTTDIIIRFGPPRDNSSGLIVYQEPEVRRRLPGEPRLAQRHHARTIRMLQVDARASAEARAPVVLSQIIIGGNMLLWLAATAVGVAAVEAALALERLERLRAALAALARAAEAAKRVRIAVQTADAVGRARIATGVAAEATGGAAELAGATAAEQVVADEAMAAASEAVAPRVMRVATEVARYYFR